MVVDDVDAGVCWKYPRAQLCELGAESLYRPACRHVSGILDKRGYKKLDAIGGYSSGQNKID